MIIQNRVIQDLLTERKRQDDKFGPRNNHSPERWIVILAEEFGEVSNALIEGDHQNYYDELIQVAAVAVAACECYWREKYRNPGSTQMDGLPGD